MTTKKNTAIDVLIEKLGYLADWKQCGEREGETVKDWELSSQAPPPKTTTCLCGKEDLVRNYYIRSRKKGLDEEQVVYVVGSSCISHFSKRKSCSNCGNLYRHRQGCKGLCKECSKRKCDYPLGSNGEVCGKTHESKRWNLCKDHRIGVKGYCSICKWYLPTEEHVCPEFVVKCEYCLERYKQKENHFCEGCGEKLLQRQLKFGKHDDLTWGELLERHPLYMRIWFINPQFEFKPIKDAHEFKFLKGKIVERLKTMDKKRSKILCV